MSQTEPRFTGDSYEVIPWSRGQDVLIFQRFGSYQGEWLMLAKDAETYFVYKDYYGSCSGCDAWEGARNYAEDGMSLEDAKAFAKDYLPFLEIPKQTMRNLVHNDTLAQVMPANVRDMYAEVDMPGFTRDATLAAKLAEDLDITVSDILSAKNQELKQKALKKFGYEKFVAEANMEEIHRDGENALLRKDDIVFAYVKDSSTPRRYLLRVPPDSKTVHDAIAWTFNMPPAQYKPLIET